MKTLFSNKVYDILCWFSLIVLDAAGVFYRALSEIWNWPAGDKVLASCAAASLFLGILLGISKADYQKKLKDQETESRGENE